MNYLKLLGELEMKASKAYDEAGFKVTQELLKTLSNVEIPESLRKEPPIFDQEAPLSEYSDEDY